MKRKLRYTAKRSAFIRVSGEAQLFRPTGLHGKLFVRSAMGRWQPVVGRQHPTRSGRRSAKKGVAALDSDCDCGDAQNNLPAVAKHRLSFIEPGRIGHFKQILTVVK
jgi:hypothetical protein